MKKVLVFITDGFADWEASYVTAELNKPGTGFQVQTIAIDKDPKISMGGLTILPDYSLQDSSFKQDLVMLIIPGGTGWREEKNHRVEKLVSFCFEHNIPVAAICDATTCLGNHGFLEHYRHTGNSLPYLKEGAPNYRGDEKYVDKQSVSDGCLITANGSGALEFSRDILNKLDVLKGKELEEWYDLFKNGFIKS
ncbi:type 1 glutamine amidotransferase family protein [Priestia megaterium]|uniref:type 1 glutamine amidotransferase family protein n=1 Tax=Priestia megaterium TaxID=1404 RepID=UPI000BEBAA5A|nr:type 1 glutamine amidotransferase family protein [Priestia megaterium]MDP9579859.1 putative intracellular protease/amidase [Bacillus sp. 1751]MDH2449509.1 glutamine amidotransferase [Priestia megaterium]MDL5148967.1 type 1 glutamine amidotransferase family protein [Priestia megaterium]MED4068432.1 glutamine amidotransferase [Priestia megaterium]PEA36956.1 glutamine amidotransferase [Priestia megaterium]